MSDPDQSYAGSEREFLHDLCNSLAIAYGNIKLLSVRLAADTALPTQEKEKILEKVNKALTSFDRANGLLEDRRNLIRNSG